METSTFKTSGMHCPSCSMLIEMTLTEMPGVVSAKADQARGTTVVTYDPSVLDTTAIASAIRGAGYDAELAA